jgi:hypothetical protein
MFDNVDVLKDVVQAASIKGDPVAKAVAALRAAGADEQTIQKVAADLRSKA